MKTCFDRIDDFVGAASEYLKDHSETQPTYAITKVLKKTPKIVKAFVEDLNDRCDDIRSDICVTNPPKDPNGVIVRDKEGRYTFTRDTDKQVRKALREARREWSSKEYIEIEPYYMKEVPSDLTDQQLEAFKGFVIEPEKVDAILSMTIHGALREAPCAPAYQCPE